MTPKIGVILFPGTNCELEALRACKRSQMQPELFRWNDDRKILKKYDGFIIPGGFSYEDRGRSGVVASKDPVMDIIKAEADKGKPIIGICNGAQILVEKGLIPGINVEELEMALAWNERVKNGKILGVGFYNEWIYIRHDVTPGRSAFNRFDKDLVMRIPVAHGEGRFTTKTKELLDNLIKNEQTLFRYCDANGKIDAEFPVNPNGALYNLAGVCNMEGNVLALMPHPERTLNGQAIFDSMAEYISSPKKTPVLKRGLKKITAPVEEAVKKMKTAPDIEMGVELIITDNEERTIENAVRKLGFKDARLKRKIYYGFYADKKNGLKELAVKLINTGEILNLNKEIPTVRIGGKTYAFDKHTGLHEKSADATGSHEFVAMDLDNFSGKNIHAKIKPHLKDNEIKQVVRGVQWTISLKKQDQLNPLIATHIFHNPHSMNLVKV